MGPYLLYRFEWRSMDFIQFIGPYLLVDFAGNGTVHAAAAGDQILFFFSHILLLARSSRACFAYPAI